jgi:hypothetical protein
MALTYPDVDDGGYPTNNDIAPLSQLPPESTIITLADWYVPFILFYTFVSQPRRIGTISRQPRPRRVRRSAHFFFFFHQPT